MDFEDDDTARAYKAIQEQLDQWTSPRLEQGSTAWTDVSAMTMDDEDGLVITRKKTSGGGDGDDDDDDDNHGRPSFPYEHSVMDWWNRELVDPAPKDDTGDKDEDEIVVPASKLRTTAITTTTTTTTTPFKPKFTMPTVERAATPIMSNSSNKKKKMPYVNTLTGGGTAGAPFSKAAPRSSPLLHHLEGSVEGNDMRQRMGVVKESDGGGVGPVEGEEEDMLPVNVQSPWIPEYGAAQTMTDMVGQQNQQGTGKALYSSTLTATPRAISPYRNQQYEYRRYHDALLAFWKARCSLSHRIGMDREERALSIMAQEEQEQELQDFAVPLSGDTMLAQEETSVEMDFLRTLKSLCWERDPVAQEKRDWMSRREGNFWALLQELRALGLAAMLWADDGASDRQNSQAQAAFWDSQAAQIHATPKELLESMTAETAPLVLKRRKKILNWIEHCLDQLVPTDARASVTRPTTSGEINSIFANVGGGSNRYLEKAMKSCLALILAGRLNEARLLLRKAGYPSIAAKIGGGAPAGFEKMADEGNGTVEHVKVGNVNRPLWKRQMWNLSTKLKSNSHSSNENAAIHSILADDYHTAMENHAMRSWEKSLYVLFRAIWGRYEDEILHLHNNNRRRLRPPYPGTQYQEYERQQLQATRQLTNMTERGVLDMIHLSPHEEVRGSGSPCGAIASFLIGVSAVTNFLSEETDALTRDYTADEESDYDVARLRFVTHLLIYLDSLSACTTPIYFDNVAECKNQVLFAYVEHLANSEDLWNYLVLYASLLPEQVLLDYFPIILTKVEGGEERKMMVRQAREFFPSNGMDLTILRHVVRLMLAMEDSPEESDGDLSTPTRSDVRKMRSIQWLCFVEQHMGDALIAANMLLRQFLLASKFASANMFLQDFLPGEVVEMVMSGAMEPPNKLDDEDVIAENEGYKLRVAQARGEHTAFRSYLKAIRAVDEWTLVVSSTPASVGDVDDKMDMSSLNDPEQEIAKSMERRGWANQKRKTSQSIVEAAETARKNILSVLLHDGGWLADNDHELKWEDNTEEGIQRKQEIQALRSRLLPHAVKLFHKVCEESAAWMWASLLDGIPLLGSNPKEVLEALVNDGAANEQSPLSPRYWTQEALNITETISSEEYLILRAFDSGDLKEVLTKMSDIALIDLIYSA